jgi:hypothetical protein
MPGAALPPPSAAGAAPAEATGSPVPPSAAPDSPPSAADAPPPSAAPAPGSAGPPPGVAPPLPPDVIPPAPPPPPNEEAGYEDVRLRSGLALREFGLSGAISADTHGHAAALGSGLLGMRGTGDMELRGVSIRHRDQAAIGATRGGLEGTASLDLAVGGRLSLLPDQGPFARVGVRAGVFGSPAIEESWLELPQGQLGYQYMSGPIQLELAARSGLMLTGRMEMPDVRRSYSTQPEVGGYAIARWRWLRAEFEYLWLHLDHSFDKLQRGELRVCVVVRLVSACFFGTQYQEFGRAPERREARWIRAGISVGLIREILR